MIQEKPKELTYLQKHWKLLLIIATLIVLVTIFSIYWHIESLKNPELEVINFQWTDNHPWFVSPYVHVEGTIFNSGTYTANNVVLKVRTYDVDNVLLKTEIIDIGTVEGKSYKNFNVDFEYSGDANHLEYELSWTKH